MDGVDILGTVFSTVTPMVFLVALFLLLKQRKLQATVWLLWGIGFAYSIIDIFLFVFILSNSSAQTKYWAQIVIWLKQSLAGIEHWLFAIEYYYSSRLIELKLNPLTKAKLVDRRLFTKIFWAVSLVYVMAQIACCIGQR